MRLPCFLVVGLIGFSLLACDGEHAVTSPESGILAKKSAESPDVVVIPPTTVSSDPMQQLENSIATLNAIQQAINETPTQGRVIQFEPGIYDLSAVVILNPADPDNPRAGYSIGRICELMPSPGCAGFPVAHYYNPPGFPEFGTYVSGIWILGIDRLTIQGALAPDGSPATIVRGNQDPLLLGDVEWNVLGTYNSLFNVAGGLGGTASEVTFRGIGFEYFTEAITATSWSGNLAYGDPPELGEGTEDLLIESCYFTVDAYHGAGLGGRHSGVTIRDNVFENRRGCATCDRGLFTLAGWDGRYPYKTTITGNHFVSSIDAIRLYQQQVGTVVADNRVENAPTPWAYGIFGWFGPFGDVDFGEVAPANCLIRGNDISGGGVGISLFGTKGCRIENNRISGAERGIWAEWTVSRVPFGTVFQSMATEENLFQGNSVEGADIGIFLGAFARNNTLRGNRIKGSAFVDYLLSGTDDFGFISFGPASGNTIVGTSFKNSVYDWTGCLPGIGNCPQVDEDSDGMFGEDDIDFVNNDEDALFGASLIDEDPPEEPNYISGMQAVYGGMTPPWAGRDSDGDGLADHQERKLCLDPTRADSDGDGVSDSSELAGGTLPNCGPSFANRRFVP